MAKKLVALILIISGLTLTVGCGTGFSDADIDKVKQSIREEFSKRDGVTITDVEMLRESPKKLTGFVKAQVSMFGVSREIMSACTATMGDSNEYIWNCG